MVTYFGRPYHLQAALVITHLAVACEHDLTHCGHMLRNLENSGAPQSNLANHSGRREPRQHRGYLGRHLPKSTLDKAHNRHARLASGIRSKGNATNCHLRQAV